MLNAILPDAIQRWIDEKNWKELAKTQVPWPDSEIVVPDIVDLLLNLDKRDRVLFFRALPNDLATDVLASLDSETTDKLLIELTDHETRTLLANLSPDDRTYLLGELPGQVTQRLLNLLSPEDLREARSLLGYPEDSVGRLMTPDYVAVRREWTIQEALDHIRRTADERDTVTMVYVVDAWWKLIDALPLHQFVLTEPTATVESIMDNSFINLNATDDREEAVRLMRRYNRLALPVLDTRGVLLGIVTVDDVLEVAEEETTEDFHKSAGVMPIRGGYWETGRMILFRSRIGWLAGLVLVNLISSGVIAAYEETLAAFVALAFFIPLIIDTGGNAGSQSATMMIRSISTGEIKLNQWMKVFLKELVIGLFIGVTLGLMGLALGTFRGGVLIGLVVFCTMATILVLTNLIGMALPFLLTKVGLDPAIASGPLITSVADAVGLIVYFSFATMILGL